MHPQGAAGERAPVSGRQLRQMDQGDLQHWARFRKRGERRRPRRSRWARRSSSGS